jgi:hypothetical protein
MDTAPETSAMEFDMSEIDAGIKNPANNDFMDYLESITPTHYKWGKKLTLVQVMSWSQVNPHPRPQILP